MPTSHKPPFSHSLIVTQAGIKAGVREPTEHGGTAVEGCQFRIADADDHAVCFCFTRGNANMVVAALNAAHSQT